MTLELIIVGAVISVAVTIGLPLWNAARGARKDAAEAGQTLGRILERLDAMDKRLDRIERKVFNGA